MKKIVLVSLIGIFLATQGLACIPEDASDFPVEGVKLQKGTIAQVIGQIANHSGTDYKLVNLNLTFFDKDENLVGVTPLSFRSMDDGVTKAFKSPIDFDPENVQSVRAEFNSGIEK